MPTLLGPEYSPLWRGTYPHMLPEDIPVWNAYLSRHAAEFIRLFYDVRIGGVLTTDQAADPKMRDMYYNVTAKRIDVLAELAKEIWIIEVAVNPGLRATGQLLSYMALWFEDPKIMKPAVGVLVSKTLDADLKRVLEFHGMRSRLADSD